MKLSELFKKKSEPVTTGNSVIDFYNNYDEEGRLMRKSRMPEYLTTMKYIEKHLTPGAKIIEIGAGTGRYSLALAELGYDVTAVELVPHNIEIMKKKVKPHHHIKIFEGNACDMSVFKSDTYDIVLLLGPMYHLFNDEDKHKALGEAIRLAKTDGVIYASYCNNDTSMYKFFYKNIVLDYLEKGLIKYQIKYPISETTAFIKPYLYVETAIFMKPFPFEIREADTYVYRFLKEQEQEQIIEQYGLNPFSIKVQTLDRTFIDKMFALGDYYLTGKTKGYSRHLYDLYKIMPEIAFDNSFFELYDEVKEIRSKDVDCPSAKPEQNLKELLEKIYETDYFKSDYEDVTKELLFEDVPYNVVKNNLKSAIEKAF